METTNNLSLPYIMPSQAQKHVTHNEALRLLDTIVQLSVASRSQTVPPGLPGEGTRHIVAGGATEAWEGWDGDIAAFTDGDWTRIAPRPGWRAWVEDEGVLCVWNGSQWSDLGNGGEAEFDGLGIRTSADATNRLAVKADGALFSHDDVTPGSGNMRATLNKAAAGNDAGFVFQTHWSSRALFGLLGSDSFELKVSPNGSDFFTSLKANSADGKLKLGGDPFFNFATLNIQGRALTGTGNSWFGMCVTNTNSDTTNKGGAVLVGAPYNNANNPFMVLGPWATSAAHIVYYGGGGWGVPDATSHWFYAGTHQPATPNTATRAFTVENSGIFSHRNNAPFADNSYSLGTSSLRWSVVYAATGTINTSDGRLKDVEGPVPLGLDFVKDLRPIAYRWKVGGYEVAREFGPDPMAKSEHDVGPCAIDTYEPKPGGRTHYGLVAQEVKAALEAHGVADFAGWTLADKDDPESEQGLRYEQFVPILVRAVQELTVKNAMLEERMAKLESPAS